MKIATSLLLATGASAAAAAYTQIVSASCESEGMVPVTDPSECHAAIKSTLGEEYPYVTMYGSAGCDMGSDGVDYGFCNGNSNSKPEGCSQKGKYFYSNTGKSDASCSATYQCLCKSAGDPDDEDDEEAPVEPPVTTEPPMPTEPNEGYAIVTNGETSCEAAGFQSILKPDKCLEAIDSYRTPGNKFEDEFWADYIPKTNLHGDHSFDCDIGTDKVDYGSCMGPWETSPKGCSWKNSIMYGNDRAKPSSAPCNANYPCYCKRGTATEPPATEPPATEAPVEPTPPPATEPPVVVVVEPEQPEEPTPVVPVTCPRGTMTCVDGTSVGRDPANNCEFFACPTPTMGGSSGGDSTVATDNTGDKKLGTDLGADLGGNPGLSTPLSGDMDSGTAVAEQDSMPAADKAKIEAAVNGMSESDDLDLASLSLLLGSNELAQRLMDEADADQSGSVSAQEVKDWWAQQLTEETSAASTTTLSVAAAIVCAFVIMA